MIPGDPALTMLGERATPEKVAEVRKRLGLDRPIWQQYGIYMGRVLQGDLGVSIVRARAGDARPPPPLPGHRRAGDRRHRPRAALRHSHRHRLGRVAELVDGQRLARLGPGRRLDADLLARGDAGLVVRRRAPVAADRGSGSTARPTTSRSQLRDPGRAAAGQLGALRDAAPPPGAPGGRAGHDPAGGHRPHDPASMLEVLSRDYIRTAEAKGLPGPVVVLHHALRNAFCLS